MSIDDWFRVALVIVLAINFPIGLFHRLKANASGERISHRPEGRLMFVSLRLLGAVGFGSFLAYLINPQWMKWSEVPVSLPVRWSGLVLGILTAPLLLWTLNALGKNLTDTVVTRVDHTLVMHGPYRYIRHPFYVVALLIIVSATLISANAFVGLIGFAAFLLLAIRTCNEERMLVDRFGDRYRAYQLRTGKFVPRLFRA